MPKATKKSPKSATKSPKGKGKASKKPVLPAVPEIPPGPGAEETGYRLAEAAQRLEAPDAALEQAIREVHPDEVLHAEGVQVATDRILADGERLCSKALVHLESKDPEVQQAARKAGLTRPLVALTVDALRRLQGTQEQVASGREKQSSKRAVGAVTIESAVAQGRALKRQTLERLTLVRKADVVLEEAILQASARALKPAQLAAQLTSLATIVGGLSTHTNATVRSLAAAKALGGEDATELAQAAELITRITSRLTPGNVRNEEQQAQLDVLDGLCLVLIDDVLRALRAMARMTGKVRRPVLFNLLTYFGNRGKAEDEPEEPTPTPA